MPSHSFPSVSKSRLFRSNSYNLLTIINDHSSSIAKLRKKLLESIKCEVGAMKRRCSAVPHADIIIATIYAFRRIFLFCVMTK